MRRRRLVPALWVLVVLVASGVAAIGRPAPVPAADAREYAANAMNLVTYRVFSAEPYRLDRAPKPSLIDAAPLVVLEQAALASVDPALARSFACILTQRPASGCSIAFLSLKLVHWAETLIFLACLGGTARLVAGRADIAWASVFAALLCKEMYKYDGLALTEPIFLAAIGLFLYGWTRALLADGAGIASWAAAGLAAGLATLAKPGAAVLIGAIGLVLLLAVLLKRRTVGRAVAMAVVIGLGFAATVAPWLYRNARVSGEIAFSDPTYLARSLADRASYNRMGWRDWGIAWIDYLPDFGDKLAAALFGQAAADRLGWGPTSYYVRYRTAIYRSAADAAAPRPATGILLREQVLEQPVKHVAVSAVLLWRGMFIGHYWGLAGLVALIAFFAWAGAWWEIAVVAVPTWTLAALNAAVSVSLTRYNLQLIVPEAIALGWLIVLGGQRLAARRATSRRPA